MHIEKVGVIYSLNTINVNTSLISANDLVIRLINLMLEYEHLDSMFFYTCNRFSELERDFSLYNVRDEYANSLKLSDNYIEKFGIFDDRANLKEERTKALTDFLKRINEGEVSFKYGGDE